MYLWHVVKIMHAHLLYWVSNQKLQSITLYTLQSTGTYTTAAAAAAAATTYYVLYYTHDITESPPRSAKEKSAPGASRSKADSILNTCNELCIVISKTTL